MLNYEIDKAIASGNEYRACNNALEEKVASEKRASTRTMQDVKPLKVEAQELREKTRC